MFATPALAPDVKRGGAACAAPPVFDSFPYDAYERRLTALRVTTSAMPAAARPRTGHQLSEP